MITNMAKYVTKLMSDLFLHGDLIFQSFVPGHSS